MIMKLKLNVLKLQYHRCPLGGVRRSEPIAIDPHDKKSTFTEEIGLNIFTA